MGRPDGHAGGDGRLKVDPVEARFREAVALQRRGNYAAAVPIYEEILRSRPDLAIAQENLALALLGCGDYGRGFPLYDLRFTRTAGRVPRPTLSFPEWQGEPLAGKSILIWTEQGYGDQIMFARFAPELAARGAQVSILVPPALARLFAELPARILVAEGQVSIPRHDFWIMPGSIPGRLGTTQESLPAAPYLRATADSPGRGEISGQGFGLAWRGDPKHHNDQARSLPDAMAARLLAAGARSLHPEDTGARDFADTAEIIASLSTVIAVDTSVAHLAGAMGKPVWVLLPVENGDWRWMSERTDSPWYPSARLFRQPKAGDWEPVIAAVLARIAPAAP